MIIQIQTKNQGLVTVSIDDRLFGIFRLDFENRDEAIAELCMAHAGGSATPEQLSDMLNDYMTGWIGEFLLWSHGVKS